jgi:hypothetical protein
MRWTDAFERVRKETFPQVFVIARRWLAHCVVGVACASRTRLVLTVAVQSGLNSK